MADEADIEDSGRTVELALSELSGALTSERDDLRDALPGLEPDRRVTDWGRSERLERLVDRTLYGFLYHYWFRVAVDGIENVPSAGGALLVANHGGALPPDGAMIAKAIAEEHPRPRPIALATERSYAGIPGVGMLLTKVGAVSGHPANVHRLLFDEEQLVLAFPEGREGSSKAFSERYRLRGFSGRGWVEAALRAGVPIVPVAVVGSEEAVPVLARVGLLRRLTRLPAVPVAPLIPLPAKFSIRFLEPISTAGLGPEPWRDAGLLAALSHDVRALIQENVLEMVADRRSVWLG
jgi:1-acyl-sn-glycerol-3-phosphate acyltransferase